MNTQYIVQNGNKSVYDWKKKEHFKVSKIKYATQACILTIYKKISWEKDVSLFFHKKSEKPLETITKFIYAQKREYNFFGKESYMNWFKLINIDHLYLDYYYIL